METWEVVLIITLVTIAVSVLARNEIPLSLITVLDNTFFQLAVLGATLAVATISPAVALVTIATVVVVYYIRNLAKLQMITPEVSRIEVVKEVVVVEKPTATTEPTEVEPPISNGVLPNVNIRLPVDNSDVIQNAMKEHESRPPMIPKMSIGTRASMVGNAPVINQLAPVHEKFENPRSEEEDVEPLDEEENMNGEAPGAYESPFPGGNVNEGFSNPAGFSVDGQGPEEPLAQFEVRPFNENQGQYNLQEPRPISNVDKYELADYMPGNDMGTNEFRPVGVSIDDKVSNLNVQFNTSPAAPPNFDNAVPSRESKTATTPLW